MNQSRRISSVAVISATPRGKMSGRSWIWLAVEFALRFLLSGALLAVTIAQTLWTLFRCISVSVGPTPPPAP